MHDAQVAGLQGKHKPMKEVDMDSIHGTNAYNYQMMTVMTADENGEGFLVAFCFSNRVDECSMRTFLTIVKENVGCF